MFRAVEILRDLWIGQPRRSESIADNPTIDLPLFQQRLAQTIAWCSSHVVVSEPATCLRSMDSRPPSRGVASELNASWEAIVTALAVSKRNWIHDQGKLPVGLANGRLLISTSITDGLDDGATGVDSQGFFDLEDLPPWDTWLCYLPGDPSTTEYRHGYLMSWVPPEFIDLAQMGMEVDYMDCLCWAEDVDTTFTRQLKAAGLFE